MCILANKILADTTYEFDFTEDCIAWCPGTVLGDFDFGRLC